MGIEHASEKAMGMTDAVWERHANPWSGWTRVLTLPLFVLAVWSRVWIGVHAWWAVAAVVVWTWWNPRAFPPPRSVDNWMSKGVLGERVWLADKPGTVAPHHKRVARVLIAASAAGTIAMGIGLYLLDWTWTLTGMLTAMGGKLWFLDRMVWILADQPNSAAEGPELA